MSIQSGSIYGTIPYGTAYYGRPLAEGVTLPLYTAQPFVAKPLDYFTIQLTWSVPAKTTGQIRLVRNSFSTPSDENDGLVLAQQIATSPPIFVDDSFTPQQQGQMYYYSLWYLTASGDTPANTWFRAGDVETVLPKDWGYANQLFNLLPARFQDLDVQLGIIHQLTTTLDLIGTADASSTIEGTLTNTGGMSGSARATSTTTDQPPAGSSLYDTGTYDTATYDSGVQQTDLISGSAEAVSTETGSVAVASPGYGLGGYGTSGYGE